MSNYSYKALDGNGENKKGTIDADSPEHATNLLSTRGLIPLKITELRGSSKDEGVGGFAALISSVKHQELIIFTKQFRTMFRSGVPMLKLLDVLAKQTENPKLNNVITSMSQDIEEGASLYEAFLKHPKIFNALYCGMIKAGEASGSLNDVLERLIYIIEHESKIKSDIKSALQYPVIVVFFLTIAFFILLTQVIPKFSKIFKSAGLEIPLPTKISLELYNFLSGNWIIIICTSIIVITAAIFYLKTYRGQYLKDKLFLKLPVLGPLLVKAAMSRFASIFSILQVSGVSGRDSFGILEGTIGNTAIASEFKQINEQLEEGHGIAKPLGNAEYFTPIVINMVAIGEESGNLDEMLSEISSHYDFEVEYAVNSLSEIIGPVLVVGLAFVVGFFALAIFLPMWDMMQVVN
ncbi:MAG: type II secretion system F family protein [Desulfobacterales bacterium]|jgi:type II secretory pathway component PulF|nr:type II secretion system F family protein [Desulfobacteraceae bacterium]MBT7086421.1 type II secretion system F family protein [Desulfobacterales bacterium]